MGVNDTIKTVNSTLRTLLAIVVVGGAGYAGYIGYALYNEPQKKLAEKQLELEKALTDLKTRDAQVTQLNDKLARVEVAMRLLKVRRRLARLTVLDQHQDVALGMPISKIEFVEINDEGQPIGEPKQFEIQGDQVYVDYLRVTFDDKYVEAVGPRSLDGDLPVSTHLRRASAGGRGLPARPGRHASHRLRPRHADV